MLLLTCGFVSYKVAAGDCNKNRFSHILFNGDLLKLELFFPDHTSSGRMYRHGNLYHYLQSQKVTTILSMFSNLLDVASDIGFAKAAFETFPCVGMISTASVCTGASAVFLCWYSDYQNWKDGFTAKVRRIQRLRWSYLNSFFLKEIFQLYLRIILVVSVEDAVQITLAIYMFYAGEQLFWAYLAVIMSFQMILSRFIFVIMTSNSKDVTRYHT